MRTLSSVCVLTLLVFSFSACAPTQSNYEGAALLGAVGAGAGALIDKDNPWRGAAIGAGIGALAGAGMAEVSKRAAREAVASGQPVTYSQRTTTGWNRVEAVPTMRGGQRCAVVKTYENGRLASETLECY